MGIGMIAVVVVAVVLVVYLVRNLSAPVAHGAGGAHSGSYSGPGVTQQQTPATQAHVETPKEIVQRRYAAGEIDRDEYLQKLADL